MGGNDYRVGRKQVSFVVDVVLWERVRVAAAGAGVSVTAWVSGALEEFLEGDVVEIPRVGPDWGAVLAAGQAAKRVVDVPVVVDDVRDPLEEIA